jgi:ferredoxin-NADP reductase
MATSMSTLRARRRAGSPQSTRQEAIVSAIADLGAGAKCYTLASATGAALASFESGSSIPVFTEIAGSLIEQDYSLASSPRQAENGTYELVVKPDAGGYVSTHLAKTWQPGSRVILGMPRETELHRLLHRASKLVAIAGGMGVIPFRSMAKALAEGDIDTELTLFCCADGPEDLLFQDEWRQLEAQAGGALNVVPVFTGRQIDGCERGPITRDMLARHADLSQSCLYVCGPGPLVTAMSKELAPLGLPRQRLRLAFSGDTEFKRRGSSGATHQLTVRMGGDTFTALAREDETILTALEKAGLKPAANCRSSICGFCSSILVSGSYILATDEQGERTMDVRFGTLHPCCSYPRSDMEMVVTRAR